MDSQHHAMRGLRCIAMVSSQLGDAITMCEVEGAIRVTRRDRLVTSCPNGLRERCGPAQTSDGIARSSRWDRMARSAMPLPESRMRLLRFVSAP